MISTIITTYKREPKVLNRSIDSVLAQTYKDIELIVVDDSPEDYQFRDCVKETVEKYMLQHTEIKIQYIQHIRNLGACAARNTGLNVATGEYIAYLDDDDEWLPDKLEKQLQIMINNDVALVYCGCFCKDEVTNRMYPRKVVYRNGKVFKELLYENFVDSTSLPLIRTQCLREIGGFDILMQSAQDCDAWLRLAKLYCFEYVPEPLVIYHIHLGEQITSDPIKKVNGLERLNLKYIEQIQGNPLLWWRRHIVITPYYAACGNLKKALNVWKKCVMKRPQNLISNLKYLRAILKAYKK